MPYTNTHSSPLSTPPLPLHTTTAAKTPPPLTAPMPHLCFYTSISHLHRTSLSLHTTTLYTSLLSLHIIISNSQPGGGTLLAHCYPDAKAPETAQKVNGWGPFFVSFSFDTAKCRDVFRRKYILYTCEYVLCMYTNTTTTREQVNGGGLVRHLYTSIDRSIRTYRCTYIHTAISMCMYIC